MSNLVRPISVLGLVSAVTATSTTTIACATGRLSDCDCGTTTKMTCTAEQTCEATTAETGNCLPVDPDCSTLIADAGSSGTRLYPFNGLVEGDRIAKIEPGMHDTGACGSPDSDECVSYLEKVKMALEKGKIQCPNVKSVYLLATAGMRSLAKNLSNKIWAKVIVKVEEVNFPDSVTVEARNLSGPEEAKFEYIATVAALEESGELQEGKQGVLGLGGRSFQFGLQTSDTDMTFESYDAGRTKTWGEIDYSKCSFGTGNGAECKAEIEKKRIDWKHA